MEEQNNFVDPEVEGKNVLLVSVGQDSTKESVYVHLKSMGAHLYVLEGKDNPFASDLERNGVFKKYLRMDLTSRPSLVKDCIEVIDQLGVEFDGILTYWDDAVGLAVRLSNYYKLPGNQISSIDIAHDKKMARVTLSKDGFSSPKFATINSEEDLIEVAKSFKFPVILKPLYGAASIGVIKVDSMDEILQKYRASVQILDSELCSGGLMGLTFQESPAGNIEQNVRAYCLEEFLDGPEYDCDVIMFNGEIVYAKTVDNLPLQAPNFCEIMELTPPCRGEEVAKRIESYSGRVLKSLGFENGLFHVEIIDDHRYGPCLVECNPRMGGGPMRGIHSDVYGVDLAEEALRISLGVAPKLKNQKEAGSKKCVTINLHAVCGGILRRDAIEAAKFLDDDPAALYYIVPNKQGEDLTGWFEGYPSKTGRIHLSYDNVTPEEAIEKANDVLNTFVKNLVSITEVRDGQEIPDDFFTARKTHFV